MQLKWVLYELIWAAVLNRGLCRAVSSKGGCASPVCDCIPRMYEKRIFESAQFYNVFTLTSDASEITKIYAYVLLFD